MMIILDYNDDNINEKTKVLYGTQNSTKALVEFVSRAKQKIDSVIDFNAPSGILYSRAYRNNTISKSISRRRWCQHQVTN